MTDRSGRILRCLEFPHSLLWIWNEVNDLMLRAPLYDREENRKLNHMAIMIKDVCCGIAVTTCLI